MTKPRRHHFVPQMIQRRFTDSTGKLYVYDKRRPEAGVYVATPANTFVQKDLNSVELKDGSLNTGLESWHSELEGAAAPLIDKIITCAIAGKVPEPSDDERNQWDNFIYHQQKRAPDTFERLGLLQNFDQNLQMHIEEYENEVRPITERERAELQSPESIRRIIQFASVVARGGGSEEVIATLAQRGIRIGVVKSSNKSFILGDHPQARMGIEPNLSHPATELWLPIAAEVAVSPGGAANSEELFPLNREQLRRINEIIFQQSNMIAGRSEALVRSLAGL